MAYRSITKPSDHFNTKLYTGNSSNNHAITGVGFQPDFTWIKNRGGDWNILTDSIRGVTKLVYSNSTAAEDTDSTYIQSFDSNGFTLGTNTDVNENSNNYASWNWLGANGTASNSNGSINSTVSANTTAGFSIGTYNGTGADNTVGHGLGVAPDMIFVKCKSTAHDWVVYHSALGNAKILTLNASTAAQSATGWQSTSPTSSVFSIDNAANSLNQSGQSFVFYAMASKKGYSKFGSYTGNGNADGTFVYTGFKPAWVMIKRTDTSGNSWFMWDNKRATHNEMVNCLLANTYDAELTDREIDFLSNGFKTRATDGNYNSSGGSYIYMAFASAPLVGTNNIPATAR